MVLEDGCLGVLVSGVMGLDSGYLWMFGIRGERGQR